MAKNSAPLSMWSVVLRSVSHLHQVKNDENATLIDNFLGGQTSIIIKLIAV